MEVLRKLYPYSFQCKGELKKLVLTVVAYVVINAIIGLVLSVLGAVPILGLIFDVLGWFIGLYFIVAVITAIMSYFNILE